MSLGTDVAAEVSAALAEAAAATGDGELIGEVLTPGARQGDPWAPSSSDIPTRRSARMLISSFKSIEVDGTLIQASDRKIMVERLEPAPQTSDQIVLAGKIYDVVSVDTLEPGGVSIYHRVQARQVGVARIYIDDYDQTVGGPSGG